jgi:hypothetical protein
MLARLLLSSAQSNDGKGTVPKTPVGSDLIPFFIKSSPAKWF